MRYLSLFSGIEAASVAWHGLGWEPAAFAEIEPFPSAVLAHRFPDVPNLGDVSKHREWQDIGAVDLVCGGSPCQSFSVAGLRKGMADPRGNLALVYLAIVDQYRPEWIVYENVPGLLSSNGGRDFGSILGGMAELGYGTAYRVLDAQFVRTCSHPFAVPQRRRRVFVVGCLGGWQRAAAVLFDGESLRGHPPPRRRAGQRPAGSLAARTSGGGGLGTDFDLDGGLIPHGPPVSPALKARDAKGPSSDGDGDGAPLLAVAHSLRGRDGGAMPEGPHDTANIRAADGGSSRSYIAQPWAVRRLTPTECERLMGLPDGWTDIPWRGKPGAPDGPRYKALGNSMAVNVMGWLGERIALVEVLG